MRTGVSNSGMIDTVVVVTGAEWLATAAVGAIPPGAVVIAADGGLDHALAAGLEPTALVGDLDSVSDSGRRWAEQHATIERHDPDKDHTDTELALARAADLNPGRLLLVSGGGDRIDHTLAAISALGHASLTSVPVIEGWWAGQRLSVVHGPGRAELDIDGTATLSLLALHGPCAGVTITGVRWPLSAADLVVGVGLGVSNETIAGEPVHVRVSSGVLTIVLTPTDDATATEPS